MTLCRASDYFFTNLLLFSPHLNAPDTAARRHLTLLSCFKGVFPRGHCSIFLLSGNNTMNDELVFYYLKSHYKLSSQTVTILFKCQMAKKTIAINVGVHY